ncbi:MAG: PAS domain S-box protein [Acidobacteria bacterium]|nr:PAS domain S-box protein [Acidobacteriota bacterium]
MNSLDEKSTTANSKKMQSIQTLIIGRLMVIFVLLVTIWIWNSGRLQLSWEMFPQGLFLVFLISVGLTIVYFFLLRIIERRYSQQVKIQFLFDALLVTWLVWRTGDLTSPYISLYIVLISVSSFFLRPLWTLFMAVISVALLTTLAMLSVNGIFESAISGQPTAKVVQIVSFHVVAFLVVGLLASRLSDRRSSGEELKETAETLASLRVLHERIIESIRSGLVTTDLDGKIYTFNAAATEITGYRAEEVRGRSIFELFGNIHEPIKLSLEAVSAGDQAPRFEADLHTPDGFAVRIGYGVSAVVFAE